MSRLYFVDDALGKRQLGESELPLRVGGKDHGGIVIPDLSDDALYAYIALSNGHAYIQPATPDAALFHNDERLSQSQWLKSGDRVQLGDAIMTWQVLGDKVSIEVVRQSTLHTLRPPEAAPPEELFAGGVEMPVHNEKFSMGRTTKTVRRLFIAAVLVLLLPAIYLIMAKPVTIEIEPQPTKLSIKGFPPAVALWGSHLMLPGTYHIGASLRGHRDLSETVEIVADGRNEFSFTLSELPGQVVIETVPPVPFEAIVDGDTIPVDGDRRVLIPRGSYRLQIKTDRYLLHSEDIEVLGYGKQQNLTVTLEPAWAVISIASDPDGAEVAIDGSSVGSTPLTAELLQGDHSITLTKSGFKPTTLERQITAGKDLELNTVKLIPVDGELTINSKPGGATVAANGVFLGTTPLTVNLAAGVTHSLRLTKAGHSAAEETVLLQADEKKTLNVDLEAEFGTIFIATVPADATVSLNGNPTDGSRRLRLPIRTHALTVSREGYIDQIVEVTPERGVSQQVEISLKKEPNQTKSSGISQDPTNQAQLPAQTTDQLPTQISAKGGQTMLLIEPDGILAMGASRREPGRRANESRRQVQLTRSFYFAQKEVTNAEFRQFKASHDSGQLDGARLNGQSQPAVNLSWQEAVQYCNWLSAEEGLPLAYKESNGKLVAVNPLNTGYRLPTEAEWAYVARKVGHEVEQRYPWSGNYPPSVVNGNYADARIADTLADVVPGYDDGHRGTSPVASFSEWPSGVHDLGGNAAEWMHDYYAVYPGEANILVNDPAGPVSGEHHVVRGSSWRHGNITELRLSYRDYSNKPRYDLGFRIARYAE